MSEPILNVVYPVVAAFALVATIIIATACILHADNRRREERAERLRQIRGRNFHR